MKWSHIMYTSNEILIFFCRDFAMDDVTDDVTITRPFETDCRIFRVCHMYFGATFFVISCILMLTMLVIYVAHR